MDGLTYPALATSTLNAAVASLQSAADRTLTTAFSTCTATSCERVQQARRHGVEVRTRRQVEAKRLSTSVPPQAAQACMRYAPRTFNPEHAPAWLLLVGLGAGAGGKGRGGTGTALHVSEGHRVGQNARAHYQRELCTHQGSHASPKPALLARSWKQQHVQGVSRGGKVLSRGTRGVRQDADIGTHTQRGQRAHCGQRIKHSLSGHAMSITPWRLIAGTRALASVSTHARWV